MGQKLKTPVAVASYPHLFEAVAGEEGGKKKYSIALVFTKAEQETPEFKALLAEAKAVGVERFGASFEKEVLKGNLHWPFKKDKEGEAAKYPNFPGCIIMNVRSDAAPGVVSRRKGPDGKPTIITKEMQVPGNVDEIYPGSLVKAGISPFAFAMTTKKGVSFGLNNVQKWGEGTRIDGRKAATDDFDADLTETPASLDDLM